MTNSPRPEWTLTDKWAVSRKRHNWILLKRSGMRWRPIGCYPASELLLNSFHKKLTCPETPALSLVEHIEHCYDVAQAAAGLFLEHIATTPFTEGETRLPAASTNLRGVDHGSY